MRRTKQIAGIILSLILIVGIYTPMPVRASGIVLTVTNTTSAPNNGQNGNNNSGNNGENNGGTDNASKSGDNSLSTLSISPGTLSPVFKYSTTSYTATVGDDVTSVTVDAKPSNSKATVESVTGHTDLKPGQNTISIVVKAENGATATYKIVVTRGGTGADAQEEPKEAENPEESKEAENPEEEPGEAEKDQGGITLNGHSFNLAATISAELVPQDFTKTTVTCKGQQVEGLQFDKGSLVLVYLTTPSTEVKNTLAVYDEASGSFCQFRKVTIGEQYLILLDPPAETGLSAGYTQTTAAVGGFENVPVFVNGAASANAETENAGETGNAEGSSDSAKAADFSLVYAVSSFGNMGWYQYDTVEGSYQRYIPTASVQDISQDVETEDTSVEMLGLQNAYKDLEEQFNKKKDVSRKTTAVMIFIIAVLVIVIANLILRGRHGEEDEAEDFDYGEPKSGARRHSRNTAEKDSIYGESGSKVRKRTHLKEDWEEESKPKVRKRERLEEDWEEESKPKVRKRARLEEEWEEDWKAEMKQGKTISQETRPMIKQEAQSQVKAQSQSQMKPQTQPQSKAQPQMKAQSQPQSKAQSQVKAQSQSQVKAQATLQSRPEPAKEPQIQRKPEMQATPKPKMRADIEDDFEVIDLEDL